MEIHILKQQHGVRTLVKPVKPITFFSHSITTTKRHNFLNTVFLCNEFKLENTILV